MERPVSPKAKVYLDTNVASARTRRDEKDELAAIDQIFEWNHSGTIILGTSHHTQREMERVPSPQHQAGLKSGLSEVDLTRDDHKVLGFHTQTDQYGGCISNPLITDIVDEQLYADILAILVTGLTSRKKKEKAKDDAKHMMYAVHSGFDYFLTHDKGILSRRAKLEKRCPSIQIRKPSQFVAKYNQGC